MDQLEMTVKGRVQGIGFRKLIEQHAKEHKIKGSVSNTEDGSVKIISSGRKDNLDDFSLWVRSNPGFSKIEIVEENWKKPSEVPKDFRIVKKHSFLNDKFKSFLNLVKHFFLKKYGKPPIHIAIIPDGNRRWARKKALMPSMGHVKATDNNSLFSIFEEAKKFGVKYFSIWGFSTENWKRNEDEKNFLFNLLLKNVKKSIRGARKYKIMIRHVGRKDRLPKKLVKELGILEEKTKNYTGFTVLLCLDYGGRDEILRAVNKIIKDKKKKIDEKTFSDYLDTAGIPDPDLVIRTSGEKRLSGFMPFQASYSEIYFVKKYFPDFSRKDLRKVIKNFMNRERRFGG